MAKWRSPADQFGRIAMGEVAEHAGARRWTGCRTMASTCRLAAILAADAAEYSRLMGTEKHTGLLRLV